MNRYIFSATGILLLAVISSMGQVKSTTKSEQQSETFHVKTELMEVRAVVTDHNGRIIENLKKEDFELLENEQPKEISFFSESKVETKTADSDLKRVQAAPADKKIQNEPSDKGQRQQQAPVRSTLLFVDNLHMSFPSLNRVKTALRHFIKEGLTDQDMVAVATSSHSLGLAEQFTRDPQVLNYAIEQIRYSSWLRESLFTPNLAARVLEARLEPLKVAVDILRREEGGTECRSLINRARAKAFQILSEGSFCRKTTVSILRDYAEQMSRIPGKRMILVFSDGFTLYDNDSGIHTDQLQPAIDRAVRSGTAIYTIDTKGLQIPPMFDVSKNMAPSSNSESLNKSGESSFLAANILGESGYLAAVCDPPDPGQLATVLYENEREVQNGLYTIAKQTGGKMFTDHNDLDIPMKQAFDANRSYYVLSYYLQPEDGDRRFRNIKVRVRNHPEYSVKAARGFTPPGKNEKQLEEAGLTPQQRLIKAANSLLPVTQINVNARADFLESETDENKITLTVDFDARKSSNNASERAAIGVEILTLIYDASGKQVDSLSARVQGKLTPQRLEQAEMNGYRFSRRLALKPGVYQARVGVREESSDHIGTAVTWLEVPELSEDRFELSSLMLLPPEDQISINNQTQNDNELKQVRLIQGIPSYGQEAFCEYSFRLRRGRGESQQSDLVFMRELLKDGVPFRQEEWVPIAKSETKPDRNGWFEIKDEMDLRSLNPGIYELRVSVKDNSSNRTIQRSAVFSIE